MIVACWSVKGGVGTTVVASGLALHLAEESDEPVLLADLAGDAPYCLGVADPPGPGVAEWSTAGADVPADALARLTAPVARGLELLPRGRGSIDGGRADLLIQVLRSTGRSVVVDCGCVVGGGVAAVVAAGADRSLLVTRLCALGLRRAATPPIRPSGLVVVREPWRALGPDVAEDLLGVPVVAEIALDAAVCRAVDAGTFATRLPRRFTTSIRRVVS